MNARIKCKHRVKSIFNIFTTTLLECKHPSIPVNRVSGNAGTLPCDPTFCYKGMRNKWEAL